MKFQCLKNSFYPDPLKVIVPVARTIEIKIARPILLSQTDKVRNTILKKILPFLTTNPEFFLLLLNWGFGKHRLLKSLEPTEFIIIMYFFIRRNVYKLY